MMRADIDRQPQQQEERGQQEQFALHRDQIPVAHIGDEHCAKSRQGEQVLDHHHACYHLGEGQSDNRYQLRQRQPQSDAQQCLFACHAAGHGHAHGLGLRGIT